MSELVITRALPDSALEPIGDGWTVRGLAVPYGVDQRVTDDGKEYYLERWEPGAFRRDVAKGGRWVNLMVGHAGDDGDRFLGRCIALEEESDGLYPSFRLDRAHPLAEQARSGELTGWSVGAKVFRTRLERATGAQVRVREQCGLNHVAATASPQYAGAGVLVAREHEVIGEPAAPRRDALAARLDAIRRPR
jgi:HK97 family phage prohead protease